MVQTMLVCSALFNLAPVSPRKRLLRRLDHAAIYLLIAGTYTPFAHRLIEAGAGPGLLVAVWTLALAGMTVKLAGFRFGEPWSSLSYVVLGWIGVLALGPLLATVSPAAMRWLLAGGLLYTACRSTSPGACRSTTRSGTASCWQGPRVISRRPCMNSGNRRPGHRPGLARDQGARALQASYTQLTYRPMVERLDRHQHEGRLEDGLFGYPQVSPDAK